MLRVTNHRYQNCLDLNSSRREQAEPGAGGKAKEALEVSFSDTFLEA